MQKLNSYLTSDKSGFTLIELIIVIAIIGILAGIAVPIFLGQRTKAYTMEAQTNLETLRALQEEYLAENGRYAPWPIKTDPNSVVALAYYSSLAGVIYGTGLETTFPAFKPGKANELYYAYMCQSQTSGTKFCCWAQPKTKTPTGAFYINHLNQYEKCTL